MRVGSPVAAILGNSLLLAEQSFAPPVLLHSKEINNRLMQNVPDWVADHISSVGNR